MSRGRGARALASALLHGAALLTSAGRLASQVPVPEPDVYVRDAGPGPSGRQLRAALARPHLLLRPARDTVVHLRRDTTYSTSVIVLGADVTVGAVVHGDVVVVGGDLFMHTGGMIEGRALAVGGCVYQSTLAIIARGAECYRDHTFDVVETPRGLALDYRRLEVRHPIPLVSLPLLFGVRIPSYDRVNGLSLPVGPRISPDEGRFEVDALVTYRSHLAALDPALLGRARLSRRTRAEASVGRFTRTNDAWIRGDIVNSIITLASGTDARNYHRADRAQGSLHRLWESSTGALEPYVGAMTERAWSAGPDAGAVSAPWSAFGRGDREEGMLRPNPPVARGRITSALAGARGEWEGYQLTTEGALHVEAPVDLPDDGRFVQLTADARVEFETFGTQRFGFETHALVTLGDSAPPQRFSYLGGSGTLPTFDLLEFGGDQLFFAESRYTVPVERIVVPLLGSPTFMLRHMIGSAGVGRLPDFEQNLGVRVALSFARVDFVVDPASRETDVSVGVALAR